MFTNVVSTLGNLKWKVLFMIFSRYCSLIHVPLIVIRCLLNFLKRCCHVVIVIVCLSACWVGCFSQVRPRCAELSLVNHSDRDPYKRNPLNGASLPLARVQFATTAAELLFILFELVRGEDGRGGIRLRNSRSEISIDQIANRSNRIWDRNSHPHLRVRPIAHPRTRLRKH